MALAEPNRVLVSSEQKVDRMEAHPGLNVFTQQRDLLDSETLQRTKYVPEQLLETYLSEAMRQVVPKRLEDGTWFTEIGLPGFDGVWGSADDLEKSVADLREALFNWVVLKIEHGDGDIPRIGDLTLNIF
jgi:predicted RNase H-like HicB family nuclease